MADAATRDLLHFDIYDTQVTVDKGVVRYLKKLDPKEFPFWTLSGRPGYDSTSPIGIISKYTGVPEVIGVYNRYGRGFGDGNVEAWKIFGEKKDESHPFVLLTPSASKQNAGYHSGYLSKLPNACMGFFEYNPECFVVHVAGKHLKNWSGIAPEGKIMLIGTPIDTKYEKVLTINKGPISGIIRKRPEYYNYCIRTDVKIIGESRIFDIDGNHLDSNRIVLKEDIESYEKFRGSEMIPEDFQSQYGPFDKIER